MPLPEDVTFADPNRKIERHRKNLPHWQQEGAAYFITFRLADSLPESKLAAWRSERDTWLALHPEPWTQDVEREYHRRFSNTMERWLDEGHGSCLLRAAGNANIVAEVLRNFDSVRYTQHAWVVMPNHVHGLFSLHADCRLEDTVKSWKGVSARRINVALGRSGSLWMTDYFDRLIRDEEHFWNCARYIRQNPVKGKLQAGRFILYESKTVKQHLDAAGV